RWRHFVLRSLTAALTAPAAQLWAPELIHGWSWPAGYRFTANAPSHPENPALRWCRRWGIHADHQGFPENSAGIDRIDHTVVPKPRSRVISIALLLVLRADRRLERCIFVSVPRAALRLHRLLTDDRQHRGRLLATHHRDARIRPHPQEARIVGAPRHAVVAGAVAAADDNGVFRHVRRRHRGDELGAVLGDALRFGLPAHHEAGDVLQK